MPLGDAVHLDRNYSQAYIGWNNEDPGYLFLWTMDHIKTMQERITNYLRGVHPSGRPILVPIESIANVMTSILESQPPRIGDIFTRYTLANTYPDGLPKRNDVVEVTERTIEIITEQIRNEIQAEEANKKLTIWNTLYGDFNPVGLRQHAPIKLKERNYKRPMFNMKY